MVDWPDACIGPAGVDVGHCRVNLAQLFNVGVADKFLKYYQQLANDKFHYNPYWDIVSLFDLSLKQIKVYPGWFDFGIKDLTDRIIRNRLNEYMISLHRRTITF